MTKQITIDQHFAPKSYFKNFANDNFLQTLNLKAGKMIKPQAYPSVCYAKFYYAQNTGTEDEISQEFEDFFTAIENNYAKHYRDIVGNILNYDQLTFEQLDALAWFVACLWIRGPRMRSQMNNMIEEAMKKLGQFAASHPNFKEDSKRALEKEGIDVTDKQVDEVIKIFLTGKYHIDFDNATHLKFIAQCQEFRDWFIAKSWRFYIAKSRKQFVASDTPVIEIYNGKTPIERMYQNHIMQRKQFFALNPQILVELVDPIRNRKKVKRKVVSDEQIEEYNLLRAQYSMDYCYANNKSDLEDLLKYYQGRPPSGRTLNSIRASQAKHSI